MGTQYKISSDLQSAAALHAERAMRQATSRRFAGDIQGARRDQLEATAWRALANRGLRGATPGPARQNITGQRLGSAIRAEAAHALLRLHAMPLQLLGHTLLRAGDFGRALPAR